MASSPPEVRASGALRVHVRLVAIAMAHAGGAVYGAVMIGVLLAAEDARHEGYPATLEAAVVVLLLYWLANLYAHALGIRLERREPLNRRLLWRSCLHELPTVEGALVPVLVLLITWAVGVSVASGVNAALWAAVAVIVVLEVVAGWRAKHGGRELWLEIGIGALMGLTLVGLKLILH
jgi:hypothetical protein